MNLKVVYDRVASGETVECRPKGNSMSGKIESGQLVTVSPLGDEKPQKGDIVLCKVRGRVFLHLIKAIKHGSQYKIGNNRGYINGWTKDVVGKVTKIDN